MPEGSQFIWITIKENQFYGYDKESDMSTLVPFNSGNPYLYTAAGKFVLGFQFASFDKSLFLCNNKPIDPSAEAAGNGGNNGNENNGTVTGGDGNGGD